ncbi:MAG: exlusion protein FxsA [Alphaproteobacteria bacterium]|nr:exlusion protein FxsA [Alphaproteobacteria bacterium]|tara:strand:+ start:1302 stop:1811 length:510 start_codon:yes stop_codon:yes gene_type:complete
MPILILALFIGIPLIEIYLFIQVGGWVGVWPTIGLVVLTAFIGTTLLRQQGLATLARAQSELDQERLPVRELFDGVCLVFGGALLLTPGFLTDAFGFALLLPPLRAILGRGVWAAMARSRNVDFSVYGARSGPRPGGGPEPGGPVIDGEEFGVRRDEEDGQPPRLRERR